MDGLLHRLRLQLHARPHVRPQRGLGYAAASGQGQGLVRGEIRAGENWEEEGDTTRYSVGLTCQEVVTGRSREGRELVQTESSLRVVCNGTMYLYNCMCTLYPQQPPSSPGGEVWQARAFSLASQIFASLRKITPHRHRGQAAASAPNL